ncbi:EF-hand domain-containing protein [Haloferula sp.]|uniref:EF-hand domain-containing protein n=1 Tax=Haloferula sp. TaxID=2497595 RepID=UPI00329CEE4C
MKVIPYLRIGLMACASSVLLSCASPSLYSVTDTDGDGRLSRIEVEILLVDTIFKNEDTNRNGQVTADEWKSANPDDDVALFNARDLNGDGVVTLEEARSHARKNGTFDKVIADLDDDNDGYISDSDFDAFMKKYKLN